MVAFEDLYALPTLSDAKASVIDIAQGAGLIVTSWILGSPSERWIEIAARTIDRFTSTITTQAIRGFFLDLATDPGDQGDLSPDQTPRPGWLSGLGEGWFGVTRGGQTFANGFFTVTNSGSTNATFAPFDLTFERTTAGSDGGHPTYRNSEDPSIYAGLGGTLTLTPGASAVIPIVAEQLGSYATSAGGDVATVVTQSFGALTGANVLPLIGTDRESRDLYIARCRIAASALSNGGPGSKYRFAANTAFDGTPLQRYDGTGAVSITRVYVSPASATGRVTVYYADPDGPAEATDVSSANANLTGISLGVITSPIGVVPDTVTIGPTVTDANTGGPGGAAAIATTISIVGSVRIRPRPGGLTGTALITAVRLAIVSSLDAAFSLFEIGGVDQVLGAGVIYTTDLAGIVRDSYSGLYDVIITTPAGASTAIAVGHVPVVATSVGDWTVTVVP